MVLGMATSTRGAKEYRLLKESSKMKMAIYHKQEETAR